MASVGMAPTSGVRESGGGVDRLPEEMNDMKIRDDKEMEATVVDGNGMETGHIIVTTIGGKNGQPKQGCKCLYLDIDDDRKEVGTTGESFDQSTYIVHEDQPWEDLNILSTEADKSKFGSHTKNSQELSVSTSGKLTKDEYHQFDREDVRTSLGYLCQGTEIY